LGDGVIDYHTVYAYDAQGRYLHDVTTTPDGMIVVNDDFTWDNAGHLIASVNVSDGTKNDEQFTYDALGRRLEYRYVFFESDVAVGRQVIAYSEFDELGHPALGTEVIDDLTKGTSRTQARSYGYDEFGRRISIEVHDASGKLTQSFKYIFDDDARTVTTMIGDQVIVDSYDADNHLIASHLTNDNPSFVEDTRNVWSGDRELTSTTTSNDPKFPSPQVDTYHYDCPAR
jgi:YD repeat-containing protein